MTILEQEIIEKFQQLDRDAQARVLQSLREATKGSFDYAAWWSGIDALQADLRNRVGDDQTTGALSLLDELREESS